MSKVFMNSNEYKILANEVEFLEPPDITELKAYEKY